ncbi:MAG TPA: tail fiber domain-containing protein [Dissulfurispiraceae bacterium]|nr:tail fiber domain-containing protein [Dissulfurispiraceae bacterium]
MKTRALLCISAMVLAVSCGSAWAATEGASNNFFGIGAGASNTGTGGNTFIGGSAGNKDIGSYNTYMGYTTGHDHTTGLGNTFIGASAGYANQDGEYNVFLGYGAGEYENGSNKLIIDNCYTQNTPPTGWCSQPLIYGEFNNRVVKIDGSLTMITIATPSDVRYKKEVRPLDASLDKVMQLTGVSYEWDKDRVNGAGYKTGKQIGLIAQEVEKVLPELVQTDSNGYKTLSYDKLAPVIIEAIKAQQKEMREKDARIEKLEKALEMMEHRMAALEGPGKTVALK